MKTAKYWSDELVAADETKPWRRITTQEQIAVVQADALRHAAKIVRNRGGENEDYHAVPIEQAAQSCA